MAILRYFPSSPRAQASLADARCRMLWRYTKKGIRSRDVTAVPVAALPPPPLARQSRDDLLGWRLVALAARGSLSPSARFVRSLRDLPALTSRRPLRGALVRCGCGVRDGARRWRACARCGSVARSRAASCAASSSGLSRAPGARVSATNGTSISPWRHTAPLPAVPAGGPVLSAASGSIRSRALPVRRRSTPA